ncbi:MAG TPA: methyl-accepting chemotaxis protein, partial [Spirochaetia bacterium]|nr:methyl-accepting chemotaxis protein [Spirochaetia bacterium]
RRGLVGIQIDLGKLSQIALSMKSGHTGYGWIADKDGLVIAHPNKDVAMSLVLSETDAKGYKGLSELGRRFLAEESGLGHYSTPDGRDVTTFFVKVPSSPGWALALTQETREIRQTATELIQVLAVTVVVALVLSILISVLVARSVAKPVDHVRVSVEHVAQGELGKARLVSDYSRKVLERGDEVGAIAVAINDMIEALVRIATDIRQASGQVSTGSQELSSTAQGPSQGATEQAASVEELSASVEELASTIRQNAENTSQADSLAQRVARNAEDSGKAVAKTSDSMGEIASRISIIEEIARQTNLLALNAAIEAARAGDAGKGFAVVASEVRKLAERSQKAAQEINGLSRDSVSVAQEAGKLLAELVPDIKKTADLILEISAASNEQSSGAEQIAKGITQMDMVVQQNASASEELAGTSEELASQAELMADTVSFFKLDGASAVRTSRSSEPSVRPSAGPRRLAPPAGSRPAVQGSPSTKPSRTAAKGAKTSAPSPEGGSGQSPKLASAPADRQSRSAATGITLKQPRDAEDSEFEEF